MADAIAEAQLIFKVEHWATVPVKDPHKVFCVRREVPAFVVGAVTVVVPAL